MTKTDSGECLCEGKRWTVASISVMAKKDDSKRFFEVKTDSGECFCKDKDSGKCFCEVKARSENDKCFYEDKDKQ